MTGRLVRAPRACTSGWVPMTTGVAEEPRPKSGIAMAPVRDYLGAAAVVMLMTAIAIPFHGTLAEIDAVMLYLLAVVIAAARYGRGPSAWPACSASLAFDLCFVPPYWTFSVFDVRFLFTFGIMFVVALLMGGLTTRVREQASTARPARAARRRPSTP